jgi:hypothetical protein
MRPTPGTCRRLLFTVFIALAGCEREKEPDLTHLRTEPINPAAQEPVGATPQNPVLPILDEWSITIEQPHVSPGKTDFFVINQGRVTHAFVIEGNGQQWRTRDIPPGAEGRLVADLQPGTYTIYCPIVDEHGVHAELGMRTTLVVR